MNGSIITGKPGITVFDAAEAAVERLGIAQSSDDVLSAWMRNQLREAYSLASLSPDPSTQNGALVYDHRGWVLGTGINTFTKGVQSTPEMFERPLKYSYIEHAERNAIYGAIVHSFDRDGFATASGPPATMVAAWAACADCARAIVQSGITLLVRHKQASEQAAHGAPDATRWEESIRLADDILVQGGVQVIDYSGSIGAVPVLHSERFWHP